MTAGTLRFEDIEVGRVFGTKHFEVSAEMVERWSALIGEDAPSELEPAHLPRSAWSVLVMPSLLAAVGPRPPGAIHARQRLRFTRSARVGEKLTATVKVTEKFRRRERNYVVQEVTVRSDAGDDVLSAWTWTVWPTSDTS